MKFLFGKLFFNLGPCRVHRFADKSPNPRSIIILSQYIQQRIRNLLNNISKASRQVVNGTKSTQPIPIAFQSAKFGNSSAAGTASSPWKSLLNHVISQCSSDSWAAELRRNAAKRLMFGTGSTFALIGFSLSKEPTLLTNKDQLDVICQEIREAFLFHRPKEAEPNREELSVENLIFGDVLAKGCNAVVYSGRTSSYHTEDTFESFEKFGGNNLAIKMMFNYDAESNAAVIWKAMHKESVPAQNGSLPAGQFGTELFKLPKHPNIVDMKCAFVDMVPNLQEGLSLYPDALPSRLYHEGLGRNMTFFLVMKRYDCCLRSFLQENKPSMRTALILLNQLLEGILFLVNHGVSHRDLKSDNILLDLSYGDSSPLLVITDFGCCLTDTENGLKIPFTTDEISRGGNLALMAPEVVNAVPGRNSRIDYTKADLWAAGAIAYEILGAKNPFYKESAPCYLMSHSYNDSDLPSLPPACPQVFTKLLKSMLKKEPKTRLGVCEAADICQALLHAPSQWIKDTASELPSDQEMIVWILALGGVVLYNEKCQSDPVADPVEHLLRTLYMSRVNFNGLKRSLRFLLSV